MLILFLVVFIDLVGFGIVIPLLPFYAEHYNASPDVVVLVLATYSLFQFFAGPLWGRLSDRIGRRPVLIITLAGAALSYVGLAFAETLLMLFIVRAFGGIMAGNIGTAFAYIADITTEENRAKGMGIVGAAFGLGFIAGPAIGGILAGSDPATADFRTPALAAAALSVVALVLAIVRLKESLSDEVRTKIAAEPPASRWTEFLSSLKQPQLGLLIVISFLSVFVFAGMETTFAMWSRRTFGWGPEQNGYLFAFVGLVSAAIQGGLAGRLSKKFGERLMIISGGLLLALGLGLVPLSANIPMLVLAMGILALGFAVMSPALNSLISKAAKDTEQGGVFGVTRSATTMARVVGPAWAGVLFAHIGLDWPYYAGAILMLGVVVLSLRTKQPEPAVAPAEEAPKA